jgi:hypothetical protein
LSTERTTKDNQKQPVPYLILGTFLPKKGVKLVLKQLYTFSFCILRSFDIRSDIKSQK